MPGGRELTPNVFWTVSVEFQFYVVTPFLLGVYTRSRRAGFIVVLSGIVLSLLLRGWCALQHSDKWYWRAMYGANTLWMPNRASEYLCGT